MLGFAILQHQMSIELNWTVPLEDWWLQQFHVVCLFGRKRGRLPGQSMWVIGGQVPSIRCMREDLDAVGANAGARNSCQAGQFVRVPLPTQDHPDNLGFLAPTSTNFAAL
jgi:hypothetical protein